MFPIFSLRDNRFTKYIVHIPGTLSDYISQLLRYIHINPMAKLPIKERAVWYMDSIHFFYVNPEKPDVPINKNDAFQKVQKRRVQEKR